MRAHSKILALHQFLWHHLEYVGFQWLPLNCMGWGKWAAVWQVLDLFSWKDFMVTRLSSSLAEHCSKHLGKFFHARNTFPCMKLYLHTYDVSWMSKHCINVVVKLGGARAQSPSMCAFNMAEEFTWPHPPSSITYVQGIEKLCSLAFSPFICFTYTHLGECGQSSSKNTVVDAFLS